MQENILQIFATPSPVVAGIVVAELDMEAAHVGTIYSRVTRLLVTSSGSFTSLGILFF